MIWTVHVPWIEKMRTNVYKANNMSSFESERKRALGRPGARWKA
jgi:hypothetical protein